MQQPEPVLAMIDLPDFSRARVLVAGDLMLDRYWHGATGRISPEAPVPVVRVEDEEHRAGGAANVAVNIATLGGEVCLLGVVGQDEAGRTLEKLLQGRGVTCCFQYQQDAPTITKLRVVSRQQQLIRLDFERGFSASADQGLVQTFRDRLAEADLVVLSDYAKGTLQDIPRLIRLARDAGCPVLADPKHRDFSPYRGADLITPNLAELEAVVGPCPDEATLVTRGTALLTEYQLGAVLVTRGEKGMTLLQAGEPPRHMPAHAREVFDVTGAGDTVISVLAAGLAVGLPLVSATQLANHAAGVVVGKLGTATVTVEELRWALSEHQAVHRGIVDEEELFALRQAARSRGETVVFTNGCFDILHAGHVTYLEQASRLGQRLVVAVNADATVRQLKGPDRPVNGLRQRLTVLAALACVDWVVPFHEPTPERLICRLRPDLLVKGGDNDPEHIPGARCVREAGGRVAVMDYVENCSTTAIIRSIRVRDR
jgi:D-beta-D-heptose 7-phosphate kinase/D-beta-D-heptose 1-phosphate adenosyltransferase